MTKKQSKTFGLVSVIAKNSNWNGNFDHTPKNNGKEYFGSDRALKFAVRNFFEQTDGKVLIKKWLKDVTPGKKIEDNTNMEVMGIKELKKKLKDDSGKDFADEFWEFDDVRQFGVLYDNISVHGPVQISTGVDLFKEGQLYDDDGTGRMVFDSKTKSASGESKETRGMFSRTFLTEAHYVYDFSVNPKNVQFFEEIERLKGNHYSDEDFERLLDGLRYGPGNLRTTQKLNCYTGFLFHTTLVDGEKSVLNNLQGKVEIKTSNNEEKRIYDITKLVDYLESKNTDIFKDIVLEYDPSEIEVIGLDKLTNGKLADKSIVIDM